MESSKKIKKGQIEDFISDSTQTALDNLPTPITNTSELTNDGSDGTSTYVELDEISLLNLGKIRIVDKLGEFFTDLTTASAYVSSFTLATITNESYSDGVYYFTVPNGSSFAEIDEFLADGLVTHSAYIEDTLGLINSFGLYALYFSSGNSILGNCTFSEQVFGETSGDNTFGNCTFGINSFVSVSGINRFRNILLSNPTDYFAPDATGRFEIYGNIGTDETANYTNFFTTSTATIWADKSKMTSNAGGLEGDLATAYANGATLFFGYILDASETESGIVNTTTQGFAGNKSIKGESSISGSMLTLKNSSDAQIARFDNNGNIVLGNGAGIGGSTFFQVNSPTGSTKIRMYNDTFMVGTSTGILGNNGGGGLTISGNSSLKLEPSNGNSGSISIGNGKVNSAEYSNIGRSFVLLNQNWTSFNGSNLAMKFMEFVNTIDFTGASGTIEVTAIKINPTLTNVPNFRAIHTLVGGAYFNTSTPQESAILQADSTTQGSMPFPRMTSTQRTAITSPSIGLHVYQTDGTEGVYVNKSTGWVFAY